MSRRYDVTILTFQGYPDLYPDDVLLRDALEEQGAKVRAAVWTDPNVDWSQSHKTLFRSTWDYFEDPTAFRAFVDRVERESTLVNSAEVVRWNMDKRYLLDLQARGFQCVPSEILTAGEPAAVAEIAERNGWHDIVIKPAISGASYLTKRVDASSPHAREHAAALLNQGRDVIVQPYLPEVDEIGEHALIFVGKKYSHAVCKLPFHGIPPDGIDHEPAIDPDPGEIAIAKRVIESVGEPVAYARVDFIPTQAGPLLMELELIEPSLFFRRSETCARDLAEEILKQN